MAGRPMPSRSIPAAGRRWPCALAPIPRAAILERSTRWGRADLGAMRLAGAEHEPAEERARVDERSAPAGRCGSGDEHVGKGEADGAGDHQAGDRGDVPGEEEEDKRAALRSLREKRQ